MLRKRLKDVHAERKVATALGAPGPWLARITGTLKQSRRPDASELIGSTKPPPLIQTMV